MSELVTIDAPDWGNLTPYDKKALRILSKISVGFEPLVRAVGVGQRSMDDLIAKGLAVEGPHCFHGRTFKITEKGWSAIEWLLVSMQ